MLAVFWVEDHVSAGRHLLTDGDLFLFKTNRSLKYKIMTFGTAPVMSF